MNSIVDAGAWYGAGGESCGEWPAGEGLRERRAKELSFFETEAKELWWEALNKMRRNFMRLWAGLGEGRAAPTVLFSLLVSILLPALVPGCVFLDLRDELAKTEKGLEHTNAQLRATAAQISSASTTLGDKVVPAMNNTASAIHDAKAGIDGAANLAEPMQQMRAEMQAMRGDLVALKGQLAATSAMIPALRQVGELREPMLRVADLRDSMTHVADLREPMSSLQQLGAPMQSVAQLREPLTATGQLVEPMKTLASQSQNLEQVSAHLGHTFLIYGLLGLALWTLATAFGVWMGLRWAR